MSLSELAAALLAVVRENAGEPLGVGGVDRDLAGPFLVIEEFLVGLRQVRRLDEIGVVGGRIVVAVDAVPAAVRSARLRDEILRFRRIELQQHVVGEPIDRRGGDQIPGALAGAVLDRDARRRILASDMRTKLTLMPVASSNTFQ